MAVWQTLWLTGWLTGKCYGWLVVWHYDQQTLWLTNSLSSCTTGRHYGWLAHLCQWLADTVVGRHIAWLWLANTELDRHIIWLIYLNDWQLLGLTGSLSESMTGRHYGWLLHYLVVRLADTIFDYVIVWFYGWKVTKNGSRGLWLVGSVSWFTICNQYNWQVHCLIYDLLAPWIISSLSGSMPDRQVLSFTGSLSGSMTLSNYCWLAHGSRHGMRLAVAKVGGLIVGLMTGRD